MKKQTLYFAYGSNLHLVQMHHRCPHSRYLGTGTLPNYKFQINTRGYANIIPSPGDHVKGLCYLLTERDEIALDVNEGVPWAYEKVWMGVECATGGVKTVGRLVEEVQEVIGVVEGVIGGEGREGEGEKIEMLVYVCKKAEEGRPRGEYVKRIGDGVVDAVKLGISREYFEKYVLPVMRGNTMEESSGF